MVGREYMVGRELWLAGREQMSQCLGRGMPASAQICSMRASIFSWVRECSQAVRKSSSSYPLIMALMPNLVRAVRWSVILSWGQLQVRIFSLLSSVVTCDLRLDCSSSMVRLYSCSNSFCFSRSVARFLFISCERSSWMKTASPEGTWVALQADSILLTACPPGPLDFVNWYLMSFMSTSNVKGTTGITTTEMVLECSLPLDSVSGTLMTLWTPASHLKILLTLGPWMRMSSALNPLDTPVSFTELVVQHLKPC